MKNLLLASVIPLFLISPAIAQEINVSETLSDMVVKNYVAMSDCNIAQNQAVSLGNTEYAFWYACENLKLMGPVHMEYFVELKKKGRLSESDIKSAIGQKKGFYERISTVEKTIEQYNNDDTKYYY